MSSGLEQVPERGAGGAGSGLRLAAPESESRRLADDSLRLLSPRGLARPGRRPLDPPCSRTRLPRSNAC